MVRGVWNDLVDQLRGSEYQFGLIVRGTPVHRIEFEVGLTDSEIAAVQNRYQFRFPPDLRAFLQTAVPRGPRFPDWRSDDESEIRECLAIPCQGILFDVEHNGFWLGEWGPRPPEIAEACMVAGELVAAAPKLIPIYGHRMIPDEPHLPGNPVFSVHQTDIIHYGFDLADYFRHEFQLPGREPWPTQMRQIRFWDIDQFQDVRWAEGSCAFDNSKQHLP